MDTGLRQQGLLTIAPGGVLRLRDAAGRHLSVVQGSVWITQHGEVRDSVLESGESLRFERKGLSLVQALDGRPAVVALEEGLEPERRATQPAHSEQVERGARRLRADTLARLGAHLLRDIGLRRERNPLAGHAPDCAHC